MVNTYYPKTLIEAVEIKDQTSCLVYAGGTDLMVKKKNETGLLPKLNQDLMFIGHLEELIKIEENINKVSIGSACKYDIILIHAKIPQILKNAIREIASPAIRNVGTLGGNIANASPAGDTLPILYALDAVIQVQNKEGIKFVPIEELIVGPGKTSLKENEIIKAIDIPLTHYSKVYYKKVGARKADAISKLSFVGLANCEAGFIKDIRLAFGAVGPTVVRSKEAETILIGESIGNPECLYEKVEAIYNQCIRPIDDQRSTATYRKTVALRLIKDFLFQLSM
jgi:CO/xanthine dehydrogenase FAD-binding subunit